MNTVVDTSLCDAAQIRAAFDQARKQGLRAKDAAQSLGLSEGAVLAAHCGEHAGSLQVQPLKPQWLEILQALQPCGPLMALTRNEAVVHEKDGIYQGFTKEGPIGLCNNEDIDLRLFFFAWHAGFAVTESGRYGQPMHSLQFYDQHGTAVHKIYVRPQTEMQAWEQVVQAFADSAQRYSFVEKRNARLSLTMPALTPLACARPGRSSRTRMTSSACSKPLAVSVSKAFGSHAVHSVSR